jgi:hypothetical protein
MAGMAGPNGGPTKFGQLFHSIGKGGGLNQTDIQAIESGTYGQAPAASPAAAPVVPLAPTPPAPTVMGSSEAPTSRRSQRRRASAGVILGETDDRLGEL